MTAPMARPSVTPTSSTSAITGTGLHPAASSFAASTPDSATTEPTERSMPPVRITKVIPTASTMRKALSTNRLSTTCAAKNPS